MNKKLFPWAVLLALVAVIAVVLLGIRLVKNPPISFSNTNPEQKILISPEEIRSIEDIGQWVFLSVETEELVDTMRGHFLGQDDALARIYTGTMHFGIDMEEVRGADWFTCSGDTARLRLPAVKLMDEAFINEAKTKTFYEVGAWDSAVLKILYQKARRQMIQRCVTSKNLKRAQENAEQEITQFITSFGFQEVEMEFGGGTRD